ncbi:MAG: tRNA pseudouridine(38-40) synthase TruA [Alphaproteobacteria bacterium]
MPRYRLTVEYDGGPFAGWQRQENGPSVQATLEDAIFALSSERVRIIGAGRTDSGVHAVGQVAHFDLDKAFAADRVRDALNYHVKPAPISVINAEVVAAEFHARFSATARHYRYRILCRRAPPALERGKVWHLMRDLDIGAMQVAAKVFVGKHDFTTFRSGECQAKSPVKTLDRLDLSSAGDEIHISAQARSFLHNQVRSMVGSLILVGEGKWTPYELDAALQAKNRARCGPVAPPEGLYLIRVDY